MNQIIKKFQWALILVAVLTISFAQTPAAYSSDSSAPDKALSFIEDVIQLDMTKYNTTLVGCFRKQPSDFELRYSLEANTGKLLAKLKFLNNALYFGRLIVLEGSPLYVQPPATNVIDMTKDFLKRYQIYTEALDFDNLRDIETMRNMLETIDVIENLTTSVGDMKLKISHNEDVTSFYWADTSNDTDLPKLSIIFQGGTFYEIRDGWNIYNVDSNELNVLKEESLRQWLDSSAPDKALSFIEDVIQLDMTKYDANLVSYTLDYPAELAGMVQENMKYTLESEENKLTVLSKIKNNSLTYFSLTVNEGSLFYAKPTANVLDRTKGLLERYQSYTKDANLIEMMDVLNSVDTIENMTKTLDNVKFEISSRVSSTSFCWKYVFNGADYTGIDVTFREDGIDFRDDRSIYKIGDTTVNVLKEEAIDIALKRVEDFSWKLTSGVEITDFNIVDEPRGEALMTHPKDKDSLTLYPYWDIVLHLDDFYPGYVYAIEVRVWADSGEVFLCQPLTLGIDIPITENLQSAPDSSPVIGTYLITASAVTLLAIAIAIGVVKKRRK